MVHPCNCPSLGVVGIQMGTRFIATQESDFTQMWKEYILGVGEMDSIVVRGVAGPMRVLQSEFGHALANVTVERLPRTCLGEDAGIAGETARMEVEEPLEHPMEKILRIHF